jgi:DNA-binding transcriptional LysR family regulator
MDACVLPDLRQLRCFVAAVDAGTMSGAADRLGLSQPGVSMAIRQLERTLGVQLIVRRPARSLLLTAAGQAFVPDARELLTRAQEVAESAASAGGAIAGRLTVGCFRTEAPFLLPGLLETFARRHPEVELDFVEGSTTELADALRAGRCEVALAYHVGLDADLEWTLLYEQAPHALVAADDPLARLGSVSIAELAQRDMVLLDLPPTTSYLAAVFAAAGSEPKVRFRTTSYELVRSLVGRGLGYTLLINRPVGDMSYEGRPLAAVPIAGPSAAIEVVLVRLADTRPTRRARAFAEHCHDVLPFAWSRGVVGRGATQSGGGNGPA